MTPGETFDELFHAILEQRDVEAFLALWAEDDEITMWGSDLVERAVGRDELGELATQIAESESVLEFEWDERAEHEEGDVAWVNAAGSLHVDDRRTDYRITVVLVRRGNDWRVHTFNGSIPD
jgi:ketosteroid isomerase-like protein